MYQHTHMNLSSVKALADRLGVKRNPRSQLSELSVCFSNSDNRLSDELYHSSCTCNWPRSSARTLTHDLLGGVGSGGAPVPDGEASLMDAG